MAGKKQAVDDPSSDDEEGSNSRTHDQQQPQESDDSDDSNETQDSHTASAFTVQPIVPKPPLKSSESTTSAFNPVSKNQEPGKVKEGNRKRPSETEREKIDKVKKRKVSGGNEEGCEVEEKKSIFKWSEKDESALLSGIIEYKAEWGDDVNSKWDVFYEYVKDVLSVDIMKSELSEKIRRLKKKFQTNAEKLQNGEELVFTKPHDKELFELSQKIWGIEGTVFEGNDKVKSSKKTNKKECIVVKDTVMEDKTHDFWSLYPRLCASLESAASSYLRLKVSNVMEYVNEMISGFGEEKAKELEDGWKAVYVMDGELYVKRAQLIYKQAEAVLDSLK